MLDGKPGVGAPKGVLLNPGLPGPNADEPPPESQPGNCVEGIGAAPGIAGAKVPGLAPVEYGSKSGVPSDADGGGPEKVGGGGDPPKNAGGP